MKALYQKIKGYVSKRFGKKDDKGTEAAQELQPQAKAHKWSKKISVSPIHLGFLMLGIVGITTILRLYPQFSKTNHVVNVGHGVPSTNPRSQDFPQEFRNNNSTANTGGQGGANRNGGPTNTAATSSGGSRHILSRPLFDNQTVTITAELSRGITLVQGEIAAGDIEARFINIVQDGSRSVSIDGNLLNSVLVGSAQGQFGQKKALLSFSEIVTPNGEHYTIQAVAIDSENRSLGVAANYSSGLGSRILGATISSALNTANHIATNRVLQNTSDSSEVTRELTRQSIEGANQPTQEANQSLTRDLRETRAVLSLDAGTLLTIRLKAAAQQSGGL